MARAAKTRGSIGAQGEVTKGRSKWSTETFSLFKTSQEARDKKQEARLEAANASIVDCPHENISIKTLNSEPWSVYSSFISAMHQWYQES